MAREIPEHWKPLLDSRGIGSYRALATKAGVGVSTVIRLLNNEGAPEVNTVAHVALALEVSVNDILGLVGATVRDHGPFQPPVESRWLTPRQREAVAAVIKSMIEPETEGGTGKSGVPRPAPIRPVLDDDVSERVFKETDLESDFAAVKKAARKRGGV